MRHALIATLAVLTAGSALAEYPEKPITIVVPLRPAARPTRSRAGFG